MNIALLGYGKEGKSAEKYLRKEYPDADIKIFDNFTAKDIASFGLDNFDLVVRTPSVQSQSEWQSVTKIFFDKCPAPIIGVTGTKGKGTTSSIITAVLQRLGKKVWLVGNIGTPALDVLGDISPNDVVVYEMSSFQLWDLQKSPHIAVILKIEPDHLNVHHDYEDYVMAKANIARYQTPEDYCVYYQENPDSYKIAELSAGEKIAYPQDDESIIKMTSILGIPGEHNRENAQAALLAVASYFECSIEELLDKFGAEISDALQNFQGLPHRLEFVRELNSVKYYDDNFATNIASTKVALEAFPDSPLVLIVGGRDKTHYEDLPELVEILKNSKNLAKVILMGESGHELAKILPAESFILAENLTEAVKDAKSVAEELNNPAIVLMSPAAASFDMFENVYDRGNQFQAIVKELM